MSAALAKFLAKLVEALFIAGPGIFQAARAGDLKLAQRRFLEAGERTLGIEVEIALAKAGKK